LRKGNKGGEWEERGDGGGVEWSGEGRVGGAGR